MSVIASGGLVGQIRAIVNEKPEVLLVTDARSAVDVVLEKSRTRGIAVGSGDQRTYRAELKYVDRAESAQDGERVLTTGDDGRFQAGLLLGTVRLDPRAPRRQISVIPAVHFEALDLVYVVLGETGLEPDGKALQGKEMSFLVWTILGVFASVLQVYLSIILEAKRGRPNFGSSFAFGWRRNESVSLPWLLFF